MIERRKPALDTVYPDTPALLDRARELFREYQRSIGVDLCFQSFEQELASLPGDYAPPRGRLFLALAGGEIAGSVCLRPVDGRTGEMKRLYVRPEFRGHGFGGRLVRLILSEAVAAGYGRIVLDTLPSMGEAQALYERLGFRDIPPYAFNPVAGVRYMALELGAAAPALGGPPTAGDQGR